MYDFLALLLVLGSVTLCETSPPLNTRLRRADLSFSSDGRIVFVEQSPNGKVRELDMEQALLDPEKERTTTIASILNIGDEQFTLGNGSTEALTHCSIQPAATDLFHRITTLLEEKSKLIHYDISFFNYSVNPLLSNMSVTYKGSKWTRVSSKQGQTLLSLAFNYGVLSLMTLNFGVEHLNIELQDEPLGCFGNLSEADKVAITMELLMRDFQAEKDVLTLQDEESICHQVVQASAAGYALFTYRCCSAGIDGVTISCKINGKNVWLRTLDILHIIVKFVVLFFGPLLAPGFFFNASLDSIRFVVKINEPLTKTICAARGMDKVKVTAKHTIDLRSTPHGKYFTKCKELLSELPYDTVIPVKIDQFEIAVDYRKLQNENKVPVGLIRSIANAVFNCGLKDVAPFKACCETNMFSHLKDIAPVRWIIFWSAVGKLLLVGLIPSLFYIRLLFFYSFENPEIAYRTHIAEQNNIHLSPHEFKMMQYLLPTHPFCITIYCLYVITLIIVAYVSLTGDMKRFQRIIFTSFADLRRMSWLKAAELVCGKVIWPFSKFGVCGCVLAPFYWLLIMPFVLLIYVIYCLPLVFITHRMIRYSARVLNKARMYRRRRNRWWWRRMMKGHMSSNATDKYYGEEHVEDGGGLEDVGNENLGLTDALLQRVGHGMKAANEQLLLGELLPDMDVEPLELDRPSSSSFRRVAIRCLAVVLLLFTVYGVSVLTTECVGFVTEILTFTLMGIIVNASSVLKYMTLLLLVVIYSYDCYNNVYKKYLKLNKALFADVKGRMKQKVEEVTSLPAHLQENTGFKACENSEQADYESPDDISTEMPMHWELNDVIMFIDNQDMPMIPRLLFQQVCQITVAGSPGPVYRSLIMASKKFFGIIFFLIFVFIVVLSFGSVYKVSSTNQTLATLAGGFVPFIMRNFMQPSTPEIELGTVSFRSKLDEIIQNFQQHWPMYDFPFVVDDGSEADEGKDAATQDKATQTRDSSSVATQTADDSQDEQHSQKPPIKDDLLFQYTDVSGAKNGNDMFVRPDVSFPTPDIMTSTDLGDHTFNATPSNQHLTPAHTPDPTAAGTPHPAHLPEVKTPIKGILAEPGTSAAPPPSDDRAGVSKDIDSAAPWSPQVTPGKTAGFEPAAGQEVDVIILLPEGGDSGWCRVWSNISLYNQEQEKMGEAVAGDSTSEDTVCKELVSVGVSE